MKTFLHLLFTLFVAFGLSIASPGRAQADEIQPAIYILLDTSGSMIYQATSEVTAHGDGSLEHPHSAGRVSRLYMAKNAISTILAAYGEVRWGFVRFDQVEGDRIVCPCTDQSDVDPSEEFDYLGNSSPRSCTGYALGPDLPGVIDKVCYNYTTGNCTAGAESGDILVPLGDDTEAAIDLWVNHQESAWPDRSDPEIRAYWATPIGGSLLTIRDQIRATDLAGDTLRGCRPYSVILLTDGDESCGGNPTSAASSLRSVVNNSEVCTNDAQCESGLCNTSLSRCQYDVKTYVIAFALQDTANADAIAASGGTVSAIPANSEDELVSAMASIIASSIKPEWCNGVDDDCDDLVDEDFPVGVACDNGLLGACFRAGNYVCTLDQASVECDAPVIAPVAETCNGIDDDCDGLIDEGLSCPTPGPEMCNGLDDDLDASTDDDGDDDPSVGITCGTDEGQCDFGVTKCIGGSVQCCEDDGLGTCTPVQGPVAETCDNLDNDCDGTVDEGLTKACYPELTQGCTETSPGVFSCVGLCRAGIHSCSAGGWGECAGAVIPQAETCDGQDNDCDAVSDEDLGSTTCGLGVCENTVQNCSGGAPQNCDPMLGAIAETCNDEDDDCNGIVDDGLQRACYDGASGCVESPPGSGNFVCVGVCAPGSAICGAGAWGACLNDVTPRAEECNNLDDDCDTLVDEDLSRSCYTGPAGTENVGLCVGGTQTCAAGVWNTCAGEVRPVSETCNNQDDDCDGVIDDMGTITCGQGICNHSVQRCVAGVTQTCDPLEGAQPETCNNVDDNCDGLIDQFYGNCYPGATAGCVETPLGSGNYTCTGMCMAGSRLCTAGSWGSCSGSVIPQAEVCDGLDNDCDGTPDNGLGSTTCGLGVCEHTVQNCSGGVTQTCDPMQGAGVEICNTLDDDCDGVIDDGLARACYSGGGGCVEGPVGTFTCTGTCRAGTSTCAAGAWGGCVADVTPVAEECNGLDDDCDGLVDEDLTRACYTGPAGTEGTGLCHGGTQTCSAGAWSTCSGEVRPVGEVCNNADDNCDGTIDNMGDLTCGVGVCNHSVPKCVAGVTQTCDPLEGAIAELCNNVDDNCDGLVDQFYGGCYPELTPGCVENPVGSGNYTCAGQCQAGSRLCTAGAWGSCSGAVVPVGEVCDGLDNDCDGATDNGLGTTTCGLGVCEHTVQNCSGGTIQTCDPMQGAIAEICNSLDDDCDGTIDDGLVRACYSGGSGCVENPPASGNFDCTGTCRAGTSVCAAGGWSGCTADILPAAEECNGLDDDCDGLVDEDLTRACYTGPAGTEGQGTCVGGTQSCTAGAWGVCTGEVRPATESCNNLDDDCDGTIDDMGDVTCGVGICNHSVPRCIAGVVQTCDPMEGAIAELCNNLDDNCDGLVDSYYGGCYPELTPGCVENPPGSGNYTCTGQCQAGSRLCTAGAWGSCSGAIIPVGEVCDGVDNDCDGTPDNGLGTTTCGLGVCEHTVDNCSGGSMQTCDPMQGAGVELCNNLDDDCDGQVDDGLLRACYSGASGCVEDPPASGNFVCTGICRTGSAACAAGGWGGCLNDVLPRAEECNGLDDDCDGLVDEGLTRTCYTGPAGTEGTGTCVGGTQSCNAGAWGVCTGEVRPATETCNNADDNCDGTIDNMGDLTCGVGVCNHSVPKCVAGVLQTCDPMEGATAELCNNLDDNCDGLVDQYYGGCYPELTEGCAENPPGSGSYVCTGACQAGTRFCAAGAWGGCSGAIVPQTELCDGIDNDCDGTLDEGFGVTTCGLGACVHTVDNCSGGSIQVCDPMAGASPETCNDQDDDCDGVVDDGLSIHCYSGGSGCTETPPGSGVFDCVGVCAPGTSICAGGSWGTCLADVLPRAEECNSLDDDCDGVVDEGLSRSCYTGPDGTLGVGTCLAGSQICGAGAWGTCSGEVRPVPEACNNLDDDCNGATDDMGQTTCGLGVCLNTVENCVAGVAQVCDPMLGAGLESCNGLDDDCDGQVDGLQEGCYPVGELGCAWDSGTGTFVCEGVCSSGVRTCPIDSGLWGECENAVVPAVEICDGLDNDCDGQVDEGLTEACYPPGSGPGSGCLDQGDGTWSCLGACAVGTRECAAGGWGNCQGLVVPEQEICDTIDNDCDGEIDEGIPGMGQPCGGVGVCAPGIRACIDGLVVCDGGGDPEPGLCDGLDNNCNGLVDEPAELLEDPRVGAACGEDVGTCTFGQNECINGALVCVGGNGPTAEICNGFDDDCDGEVDTGDICEPNHVCYTAECRLLCDPSDEQPCPAGYACIEPQDLTGTHLCYPQLAPCGGIYCDENEVCREGACVDPCAADPCDWFERCWVNRYAGQVGHETEPEYYCFDDSCSAPGHTCPNGTLCVNHACVDDPCAASPCVFTSEYCVRSDCETLETCDYECLLVPFCQLGERWDVAGQRCVPDACGDVSCDNWQLCVEGVCQDDPCYTTTCDWGQTCVLGECVEDPCQSLKCPSYTLCYIDQANGGAWCEPNPGVWTPSIPGDTMTTGGGSCSSSPNGGGGTSGFGFLGLLLAVAAFLGLRGRKLPFLRMNGLFALALLVSLSACDWAEFSLETPGVKLVPDAEVIPDTGPDVDADAETCIPGEEVCDGLDNDCNDLVDDYWAPVADGGQGHFSDDLFNCGRCGNICAYVHAQALCVDGQCQMGDCHPNWYDFDDRDENGCETSCLISAGGTEICDGTDNDCDGVADDPWVPAAEGGQDGFMTDPNNCGECGRICAFPNGQGACVGGSCTLSACNENYVDVDGSPSNGCECIMSGVDDSTCDGVDNDCSGEMDEDYAVRQCYTGMGCVDNGDGTFTCSGQCTPGTTLCTGGREQCQGQVGPVVEICDSLDNDCDGVADEGFDLQVDVNHCGACNHSCAANAPPNMRSTGCGAGVCSYVCRAGYFDHDPGAPGCEYACNPTNGGVERCDDGVDNDCDGQVDEYNALTDVNNCGACGYSCQANAPSNMDAVGCTAGACDFVCAPSYYDYDPGTPGCETFCQVSNGGVEACDGLDNDCNGQIDEAFDKTTDALHCGACNYACADNAPANMVATGCTAGNCQFACVPDHYNYDGLLSNGCEYACTVTNGGVELCDNLDNDCNGTVDVNADGTGIFQACYTGPVGTEGVGTCAPGNQRCYTGSWGPCQGETLPVSEACDTIDNDCDGSADEDFDLATSLFHCGACGNNCNAIRPPNTSATGCAAGQCQYQCVLNTYDMDGDRNTIGGNGCEYECTFTNGGVERCDDGVDNDCDGTVDEFNSLTDPLNCGACGHVCETNGPPNMNTTGCVAGACQYECMANYHDYSADPGCEYYCVITNGGVEACDGLDNDCDGTVDDGVNITTDMDHCGGCNYRCADHAPANMTATACVAGACEFACQPGHYDRDGLLSNGCEYACTVTNGGVEICDNVDNDCNGTVDVHADGTSIERACYTGPVGTENVGLCLGGTQQCFTGTWGTCTGQVLPSTELCDLVDNDCDGAVDDGFDLNTNLYNCGSCNRNCNTIRPPNTTAVSCTAGVCQYQCVSGTYDLDGNRNTIGGNGCEYACTFTNGGVERCDDGVDNDCDGTVDEFNSLTDPLNCGACGHVCETSGPPNMNTTGCLAGVCQYECMANYYDYTSAPGCEYYCVVSNGGAEACDGLDNDCDGAVDEGVNITTDMNHCGGCNYRCADHAPANMTASACVAGACQFTCTAGHYNLDGLLSNGCEYACTVTNGGAELCDNLDNDCNGTVDRLSDGTAIERACYTGPGGTENVGPCHGGTQECFTGTWGACTGQVLPSTELCDLADNDCDGTVDDGFDLNTNLYNCGSCNRNCNTIRPPNTTAVSCSAGVCQYQCVAGAYDLDGNRNTIGGNGCEYLCTFTNGGVEDCDDTIDNDCDGTVDEFNSLTDPLNCGACGHVCETSGPPNMNTTGCVAGVCQYECMANYHDYTSAPGCEYYCVVSNGGAEACDGLDNDCDGAVDEGVNITTDMNHCGGCNYRCADHAPANMTASACVAGACQFTCTAGHYNLDGLLSNGCEYACTVTNGGAELCDNLDNDCNGTVDRLSDGTSITRACYTGPGGTENVGPCHGGTQECFTGTWGSCSGQVLPVSETCDLADNDCNGVVDNGFDLNTNLYNCGSCNRNCNTIRPPNTTAISCSAGVCQYQCVTGAYDLDGNRNVIGGNGCEYLCTYTNGGVEDCDDTIDNDCDGTVDEFNSLTDPMNCGSCGHVCETSGPPNMNTTGCVAGVCQYTCAANYYDYTSSPGCEYYCVVSNGGAEACDGLDNDCDGTLDEGFDTATDLLNCGGCGYRCADHAPANMTATGCAAGNCTFACQAGHYNFDGLLSNGCEYACTVTNGGVELCDNLDNDCDGVKDEDASGNPLEQSCYTGPGGTLDVGPCRAGTQKCFGGAWNVCQGQILPQTELCDTLDNDCDGVADDGYNLNTDILNCDSCGRSCFDTTPPNASVSACVGGVCQYTCNAGYYDLNGDRNTPAGDGCEYACEPTLSAGSEDCNNLDDDCDGLVDEVADLIAPPPGYCKTGGACGGSVVSQCQLFGGVKTWVCQYPPEVDRLAGSPNKVAYAEVRCDGEDNDCDLSTDEDFLPLKGTACEDGDYGLCKGTGTVVCKADETGTECDITAKGTSQPEVCDDLDNDCDGLTDEPPWNPGSDASYVVDDVEVVSVGGHDVYVYRYEASRPDATALSSGLGNPRACSRPDVLPWNRVTYAQAQAACSLAGARLCLADEWQEACEGASNLTYPYGNTYEASTCNGYDYLMDEAVPSGDAIDCFSSSTGTFDMSGNLREWTMDYRGQTADNQDLFTLRGGSYMDNSTGLACQFTGSVYVDTAFTAHVGFRCCTTCGNGTVEADELCDDGNRDNGDACDWFCAPTAGQTCGNGVREGTEQCDDGNRLAGDGCSPSCVWDGIVPVCGNGIIEAGESCDDGNTIDGDGCESYCRRCPSGVVDDFGYERCPGGATWVDISGSGTKLGNGDESNWGITPSFTMSFYGTNRPTLYVGTNGDIKFVSGTAYANTSLPTGTWTAAILPYWDDLDSSQSGSEGVWWQVIGSSPNRILIIQWLTRHYSTNGTNNTLSFQVQIDEGTNDIHFLYPDVMLGNTTYEAGRSATIGIQGSSAYYNRYSYNTTSLTNGQVFTFYHP